jgi:phage tail-like protein
VTTGWLTAQLPRVLAEDPVLSGVVRVVEEVADTYRCEVDALEQHLDAGSASAAMLRYLASWLGADLDPSISLGRQREVLRAVGPLVGWRGTRRGVEGLLEALTGARVRVGDDGGVWTSEEPRPSPSLRVVVDLTDLGEMTGPQLYAFLADELPVGADVVLRLGGRVLERDGRALGA